MSALVTTLPLAASTRSVNWDTFIPDKLVPAIFDTLYMVSVTMVIAGLLGLIMGALLYTTRTGNIFQNRFAYTVLNVLVNIVRPIPFIILIAALGPLTSAVVQTRLGINAAIFAMNFGASFAIAGNILGTLIFFFGMTAIRWATRWYGFKYGYEKGTQIVGEAGGNTLQKITQGASVMGLFVMGSLVYRWTTINIPLKLTEYEQNGKNVEVTVQSMMDQLLPGLAALALCFLCMWLLRKRVNAIWIIFGLFAVGIAGSYLGFLSLPS